MATAIKAANDNETVVTVAVLRRLSDALLDKITACKNPACLCEQRTAYAELRDQVAYLYGCRLARRNDEAYALACSALLAAEEIL